MTFVEKTPDDPFDLNRFLVVQEGVYEQVLTELRQGKKRTHWMWFIFPQMEGLGRSATARHYAIKHRAEAEAYLHHPVLGERLVDCTEAVLGNTGRSVAAIFGSPDDVKLRSSMTLFEVVSGSNSVFSRVLEQFFQGDRDGKTLELLEE